MKGRKIERKTEGKNKKWLLIGGDHSRMIARNET